MELSKYKLLADKYFNGELSLKQEFELKNFLSTYNGDDTDLLVAKSYLVAVRNKQESNLDFDTFIGKTKVHKLRKQRTLIFMAAAVIILLFSLKIFIAPESNPVVYAYIDGKPITDKDLAMANTEQALVILSTNINKGTQSLNQLKQINKPVELLTKNK